MRLGADCFINTHPATATATATAAATVLEHDEHQLQDSYLHGEILHKRSVGFLFFQFPVVDSLSLTGKQKKTFLSQI